jgi:starch synthase
LVTPELGSSAFLSRNGHTPPCIKAGGLADACALMLDAFSDAGADVHIALPHFRRVSSPKSRWRQVHFCHDREFFYRRSVYDGCADSNLRAALAFQRDVTHYVLPHVRPDLVHCHDWMTGLIPAAARAMGIPSVFTVHNLHDQSTTLAHAEDRGIDAPKFWDRLYFHHYPSSYEADRGCNPFSLLASGIQAADRMCTVSESFLYELADGKHGASWPVVDAVRAKLSVGHARGILNALCPTVSPSRDAHLLERYQADNHVEGKRANKRALQRELGLEEDPDAPLLFWPSRLDPAQKGCGLLSDILYKLLSDYAGFGLQIAFVADGPFEVYFKGIVNMHGLGRRVAVVNFDERLSRMGYAGSDFTLMPSAYEPCGLSQMMALRYGSLPVVHATGGLKDTVKLLRGDTGNGFPFEVHDSQGLRWAIDQAIQFYLRRDDERETQVARIMREAEAAFQPQELVDAHRDLYSSILTNGAIGWLKRA